MSHLSPCVFLLWSVLTVCLAGFFFYHIWNYDRFRCLNLWRMRNGTFKRVMTYSYIVVIPVLTIYMFSFAVIKYQEGWIALPNGQVFPKPIELWSETHRSLYFPLNVLWTFSWVSEATTHLEELCFWVYLIHSGPSPTPWFKSIYFRLWLGGVVCSTIVLFTVTVTTRHNPLLNEAYMQFAGSTIGLFITLGFLPVLWVFPRFIRSVRAEGGDLEAIMRLAKFHDLNIVRTIFRFLFIIPIIMLSIDGMTPHTHELNTVIVSADLLSIVSGIGCIIQSAITLVIFFPRNLEHETQRWLDQSSDSQQQSRKRLFSSYIKSRSQTQRSHSRSQHQQHHNTQTQRAKFALTDSPEQSKIDLPIMPDHREARTYDIQLYSNESSPAAIPDAYPPHPYAYNSGYDKRGSSNHNRPPQYNNTPRDNFHPPLTGVVQSALTEANMRIFEGTVGRVNPMALYFTSPIDIQDESPVHHRRRYVAYP